LFGRGQNVKNKQKNKEEEEEEEEEHICFSVTLVNTLLSELRI